MIKGHPYDILVWYSKWRLTAEKKKEKTWGDLWLRQMDHFTIKQVRRSSSSAPVEGAVASHVRNWAGPARYSLVNAMT